MNQKTVIGILIVLVIIGGIFALSNKGQEKEAMQADIVIEKESESMVKDETMKKEETMMVKSGTYETYDVLKLVKAETGDVVLFFRASWCPTCRALDKDIKANLGNIPENLIILDIDYDNSNELKKKYGVTYQHTLVQVDKDGNMLKKWMGSRNLEEFIKEVI